jgi:hypothetical protein
MSFDEIASLLKTVEDKRREKWEQIRLQCFYSVAPYTDSKKPSDFIKFPWEVVVKQVSRISDKKRKKIATKVENIINGKG